MSYFNSRFDPYSGFGEAPRRDVRDTYRTSALDELRRPYYSDQYDEPISGRGVASTKLNDYEITSPTRSGQGQYAAYDRGGYDSYLTDDIPDRIARLQSNLPPRYDDLDRSFVRPRVAPQTLERFPGSFKQEHGYQQKRGRFSPPPQNRPRFPMKADRVERRGPKRPVPSNIPILPPAKTLTQQLKKIGKEYPIIGLKFITEFITDYTDGQSTFFYRCNLCEVSGEAKSTMAHIIDYKHRTKYIDNFKLEPANDKEDVARRAGAIETVHGRGQWATEREKKTFIPPNEVEAKLKGIKAENQRDIKEVKPSKLLTRVRLFDGEEIVDEVGDEAMDVADDSINTAKGDAKLFVLNSLADLVSTNFEIQTEEELKVVDSMLTNMKKAVLAYQDRRNEEEAAKASTFSFVESVQNVGGEDDDDADTIENPADDLVDANPE